MEIGVVCEGPSDYPAIEHFVGESLRDAGVFPTFRPLFPDMDRTRPEGGWGNVLNWLDRYPPNARAQQFFGGGLFGGSLAVSPLDAILFQLDADILNDANFRNHVKKRYAIDLVSPDDPRERADQISSVLSAALNLASIREEDAAKHIIFPAVESTETWCVAAFSVHPDNSEKLRGEHLTNAFMRALEIFERRTPQENYSNISKNHVRRAKFCQAQRHNFSRIHNDCSQFERFTRNLIEIAIRYGHVAVQVKTD